MLRLIAFAWFSCLLAIQAQTPRGQTSRPTRLTPEDLARGKQIFEAQCALCHGMKGTGGKGANLVGTPLKHAADDAALFAIIQDGIESTEMPGAWQLTDRETWLVLAHVRSLGRVGIEKLPGDPVHGKVVFTSQGCAACHIVSGVGGNVGPELTEVGQRRSADRLRQCLLQPEKALPDGFVMVRAVPLGGSAIEGIRVNEDSFTVQLRDVQGRFHSFQKQQLQALEYEREATPMPSYRNKLSAGEHGRLDCLSGEPARTAMKAAVTRPVLTLFACRTGSVWANCPRRIGPRFVVDLLRQLPGPPLLAPHANHAGERVTPARGLGLSDRPWPDRGHATDCRSGYVRHRGQRRDSTGCSHWQVSVGIGRGRFRRTSERLDLAALTVVLPSWMIWWSWARSTRILSRSTRLPVPFDGTPKWRITKPAIALRERPLRSTERSLLVSPEAKQGIRGFVDAYDSKTGRRAWRFWTIPGSDESGHESWPSEAWKTGGGSTWVSGTYDPDLRLIYWGVGNPGPDWNGDSRPGDNLYTCSLIALDADTGKLRWHFQFTPHDEHDWDANRNSGPPQRDGTRAIAQSDCNGEQERLFLSDRSRDGRVSARNAVRQTDLGEGLR